MSLENIGHSLYFFAFYDVKVYLKVIYKNDILKNELLP